MSDIEEFQKRIRSEYGPRYFDRQGNPIELMDWGNKCEDIEYKVVKQEELGQYFISTVWVGMNMSLLRPGPPMIFETMIFIENKDENHELYGYQERYSTEKEALIGHEKAKFLVNEYIHKNNEESKLEKVDE